MLNLSSFLSDPLIRRFFTRLVIFFVILSALIAGAWFAYGEAEKELKALEKPKIKQLSSLQSEVRFLQQQLSLYQQYGDKYQELVKKGLVKQQDRVFWTDSLIRLTDEYLIPSLTFSFAAEKPLSSGQFLNIKVPNGVFFYSRLDLRMDLQHEEDLIRVFETISQKISPLYLVESCRTTLADTDHEVQADFDLLEGNVSADCSLIIFHTHASNKKNPRISK